jgi:hypothetical protein
VLSGRCVLEGEHWRDRGNGDFPHDFSSLWIAPTT